jgi:hypothetical protein
MFVDNPFTLLSELLSPVFMQVYAALMIVAVALGTWLDTSHKGSAIFFARRREKAKASAQRPLGGIQIASLAAKSIGEAVVSGEFGRGKRRISHLLMMYGFLLNMITTFVMVFAYSSAANTPTILPTLWDIGAFMILGGGLWFFLSLRVNVAFDGALPYHLGRADLFVGSLIATAAFALIWHFVQTVTDNAMARLIFFGLYLFFTTLLFGSVFWSKFAHMFYKPVVAFQRRIEEADGSSDLPSPVSGRTGRS